MNVTLVSWGDLGSGAFIAAHRLHASLEGAGAKATMLVARKLGSSRTTLGPRRIIDRAAAAIAPRLDALPLRPYRQRKPSLFSTALFPDSILSRVAATSPDVVHLHWVNYGYLNPRTIPKFRAPVVWTFHDMWPMTGGCHYSAGCKGYEHRCGTCPELSSDRAADLSARVWARKQAAWRDLEITVIAPSRWMAQCARRSSLFAASRVEVIPYCLDTGVFRPLDRDACRDALGLPREAKIVLFVAMSVGGDARKGFDLLRLAASVLRERDESGRLLALVAGGEAPVGDFPVPVRSLGLLRDEISLGLVYNAADVFVCASREDNLPNTVLESMSCGTPCVGFDVGGLPDLIDHRQTGFLARPEDGADLAEGIAWVLADEARAGALGDAARAKVLRENAAEIVARRHRELYRELVESALRAR